jgi:hypothetical protein
VSATEKTTPTEVVDSYFQMWNETDGDRFFPQPGGAA